MVGRCLARLDEAEIGGHVRITRVLSDVHPVGTQGATFVGRPPSRLMADPVAWKPQGGRFAP